MSDSPKPPRSRSRSEVHEGFNKLTSPEKLSPKEREERMHRAAALRGSIADVSAEKAAQSLASAGVSIQKAFSAVNEDLLWQINQLQTIKENIELESKELERLYGARAIHEHLDVLMAEHDEKARELEVQVTAKRDEWEKAQLSHEKFVKERDDEVLKQRQREQADYTYRTAMLRKQAEDAFSEELRQRRIAERDRQESVQKDWARRDEELSLREGELVELRLLKQNHDVEINKAVAKAEAILASRLERDHKHAMELLAKDRTSEAEKYQTRIEALTQALERERDLTVALRAELVGANQKTAEIANKALEASSGQVALAAVQNTIKDSGTNGGARKS